MFLYSACTGLAEKLVQVFYNAFYGKTQRKLSWPCQVNPILNWSLPSSFPGDSMFRGLWTEAQVHPVWRPTTLHAGDQFNVYRGHYLSHPSDVVAGWSTLTRAGIPGHRDWLHFRTGQAETAGWSSGTAHFPGSHLHLRWRAPCLSWSGRKRRLQSIRCLAGKSDTYCSATWV